jgi:hypothetical protein
MYLFTHPDVNSLTKYQFNHQGINSFKILIYSPIYQLTHPDVHSLIQTSIHSLKQQFTYPHINSLVRTLVHSSRCQFTHTIIHSLNNQSSYRSPNHPPTQSPIHPIIHSPTYTHALHDLVIHLSTHAFIASTFSVSALNPENKLLVR